MSLVYRKALEFDRVLTTISNLSLRIHKRLPGSSLHQVSRDFYSTALTFQDSLQKIIKPNYLILTICYSVIGISLMGVLYGFTLIEFKFQNSLLDIATVAEASINNILLIGAAYFFLLNVERNLKRRRASKYIEVLSDYIHVGDMHQLTKDPHVYGNTYDQITNTSPTRILSKRDFQRYLVYCSELLSLISKVSVLFSQEIDDDIITKSTDDIENLSSQLTSKIWQKLMILQRIETSD